VQGQSSSSIIKPQDALLVEFSCTFLALFVGLTSHVHLTKTAQGYGVANDLYGCSWILALAVFVSITGQAGYAGVGMNQARCLGPAVLHGGSLWNGHWVFWSGPFRPA